jgi:hypothetical protein
MRVEVTNDVVDEIFVVHQGPETGEAIGHDLHARAVVEDVKITLVEVAELGTEVDGASVLVVAKEVADAAPYGVGDVGVFRDHGEKLGGDAVVEPRDDGAIILHPVAVALGGGAVDVVAESELAKDGREGACPGDVVRVVEVEDDRHAVEDVDAMDDGRCGRFGLDAECVGKARLGVGVVGGRRR